MLATFAMLLFAAATQGYFLAKSRFYESAALLVVALTMFLPNVWLDAFQSPFDELPPSGFVEAVETAGPGDRLRLRIAGPDLDTGETAETTMLMNIDADGDAQSRIDALGLILIEDGDALNLDEPAFGSSAGGTLAALLLFLIVVMLQRRRQTKPAF